MEIENQMLNHEIETKIELIYEEGIIWLTLIFIKGDFHLRPRMDFIQTLNIDNSLYTNYENVFIE